MSYNRYPTDGLTFFTPGTVQQVTQIVCVHDVAGSLNNKYFNLYTALDAIHYVVWFNVNSAGTDPMIPDTTSLEVDLSTGDTAAAVATATALALGGTLDFVADPVSATITCTNRVGYGAATHASNGAAGASPGFTITTPTDGAATVATATGQAGETRYDSNFFYVCIATNTWKRVAILTW